MHAHRASDEDNVEIAAPPTALVRKTYTVPEAAALLGISRATAYRSVRSGELRALQFGRRIVVPAPVVEEMLGSASVATDRRSA